MKKVIFCLFLINFCFSEEIILDEIVVASKEDKKPFNSSTFLDRKSINLITSKDGSITELLKTNPNITFNKNARNSTESGEISPKDISINGASHYQNNFLVDNLNFNDDINPTGNKTLFKSVWRGPALGTQAINLNADLLQSIEVFDNAVSAKYGDFQGGVIKAKTKDPSRNFSGIISYGYTNGNLEKTFIDEKVKKNYENSRGWMDKSDFSKNKFRFGIQGYASENFGLLFDYTRNSSLIKHKTKSSILDPKIANFPNEKRINENYFLKAILNASENFTLKPSFLYARQKSVGFIEDDINSKMDNIFGGYALNLDADLALNGVFIEQNLNYSEFESSRYFDFKDGLYIYKKSNLKNWGAGKTSTYGGLGDIKQVQKTFNYKLDLSFDEKNIGKTSHKFITGFEYIHKTGSHKTLTPVKEYNFTKLPNNYRCKNGNLTCINDDSFDGFGQFANSLWYYGDVDNKIKMSQISLYLEDEINYDKFTIRPGIRIQRDSLTKDFYKAFRFVSQYEFINENFIGFGLNRYYGRNIFANKLYNDTFIHQKDLTRNHPDDEWKFISNNTNSYLTTRLKLPYDDEFSLFYKGEIDNFSLNLKYIKRKSKDEIVAKSRSKAGLGALNGFDKEYAIYSNDGKTNSDIYTFSIKNKEPFIILNTKNNFELSFSHTKRKRNFNDYTDKDIDKNVLYNGDVIKSGDLPVVDYYFPNSLKFSHNTKISDFTISNFITYNDKSSALIRGFNRDKKMISYEKVDISSFWTWDMRINYSKNLNKNVNFFANLDINNILNKKYAVNKNVFGSEIYDVFDPGRNIWLEAGLRW
ncbi:TonB-dependent receptor plug domain-containing protein [Campylobacter corcagiensis]|uniref:TonB-dependent receptor plug domain-containing protein n=1 Tax=Campylobacter corcagiensis TaxID=1448857 RepID=A0A7M1LFI8_9BACT|nr:TonB-dependent receptor plug domain-containing protein [Campylobacter corcagiensis]QKF64525.1 TonB-dependent receptor [Campylobacter corcagiensis]QOQ87298.1 TonB-dependent receptor plug domain-containing protein [Campylobacter corcagiensis]